MSFPQHLVKFRKNKGLTQQALADKVGIHVMQIRRYESANSQPTLDVLRKLAINLNTSTDMLVFDKDDRSPVEDLQLEFEAVSQMNVEDQHVIKTIIESMSLKREAQRWREKKEKSL